MAANSVSIQQGIEGQAAQLLCNERRCDPRDEDLAGWHAPEWEAPQRELADHLGLDDEPRRRFEFVSAGELAASCSPPSWQIRKVLEADSLAVVFGAPEAGKSFLLIDWACCIAAGIEWRGHKVRQGPVLIVIGEGRNGYTRRLAAWSLENRTPLQSLPLFVSNMATQLTYPKACVELQDTIRDFTETHGTPVLIVIDTLARNFGPGDENSTSDMSAAVGACDALRLMTGAAVVLVHHAGKDATKGARGSMVLKGAIDAEYAMVRELDGLVRFESMKMKEAERPQPMGFRFQAVGLGFQDDEGEEVTSAVLIATEYQALTVASSNGGGGKHQRRALEILREKLERNRANVRASGRDEVEARVSLDVWRDICLAEEMPRNRFNDAKTSLMNSGKVYQEHGFVYLGEDRP